MDIVSLIDSGRIVDIMVVFVMLEVLILVAYRKKTGKGIAVPHLLANIGAGGSLMLALGAQLKGLGAITVAGCLVASLVFHITDLALRWSSGAVKR